MWGSLPKVCKHQSPETNILLWMTIPTKKKVKQNKEVQGRGRTAHIFPVPDGPAGPGRRACPVLRAGGRGSPGRAFPRRCQGETPPPFFFPEDLGRKGAPGWVGRGPQGDCGLGLPGLGRTPPPGRLAGGLHLGQHSPGALSLCCVHFQMLRSRDFHSGPQLCPPGPGSTLLAESWGLSPGPAQVDHLWDPGQRQ